MTAPDEPAQFADGVPLSPAPTVWRAAEPRGVWGRLWWWMARVLLRHLGSGRVGA